MEAYIYRCNILEAKVHSCHWGNMHRFQEWRGSWSLKGRSQLVSRWRRCLTQRCRPWSLALLNFWTTASRLNSLRYYCMYIRAGLYVNSTDDRQNELNILQTKAYLMIKELRKTITFCSVEWTWSQLEVKCILTTVWYYPRRAIYTSRMWFELPIK